MSYYNGKKVISKSGKELGKITDLVFDKSKIIGIMIGKLFIDFDFVDSADEEYLVLKIDPVSLIIGMKVFDVEGNYLGKVSDINRKAHGNVFDSIVVKKNILSKGVEVAKKDISTWHSNVVLKKTIL